MSIAVSAFVRPSRTARRLLLAWSLAHFAAAVAVAGAPLPLRWLGATWLAAVLASGGLVLAWTAARTPKTHRIDISGTGELRVTVQQGVRVSRQTRCGAGGADDGASQSPSAPLALLPGSTLWPGLMLLRLGAAHGPVKVLPIWRDSIEADAWRALAVALGVIGRPHADAEGIDELIAARELRARRSQRDPVQ